MTGSSTLDPDNFPSAPDRVLGRGHGTRALGPSDSSDSGSDVHGGGELEPEVDTGPRQGTNEDAAERGGPDLGDAYLNSDTDAGGTGERAAAGHDSGVPDGADINIDHIETLPGLGLEDSDEEEA
jgi:hypothetical protein